MNLPLRPQTFHFADAGEIPNNPSLPLVVYENALSLPTGDPASAFEIRFPEGGWQPAWRYGVYPFPHFHSTAHEVLGCFSGHATIRFGHTSGVALKIHPGDLVIIPAGVGHQNLDSSSDFLVVGGYPDGQHADLLRTGTSERELTAARQNIGLVPLPSGDPLFGPGGPLRELWDLGNR